MKIDISKDTLLQVSFFGIFFRKVEICKNMGYHKYVRQAINFQLLIHKEFICQIEQGSYI